MLFPSLQSFHFYLILIISYFPSIYSIVCSIPSPISYTLYKQIRYDTGDLELLSLFFHFLKV